MIDTDSPALAALRELVEAQAELDRWHDPESPGRNHERVNAATSRLSRAWRVAKETLRDAQWALENPEETP